MNQPLWGIDLGGTKIEGVILESIANPTPIIRTRVDTEAFKGYDHVIGQIGNLVAELKKKSGLVPTTIGIGTPGVLDPTLKTMKKLQYGRVERDAFEKGPGGIPATAGHNG